MKDFAHDYIDYGNMAKQLTPETNRVQHWSKIIETKYILHQDTLTLRTHAHNKNIETHVISDCNAKGFVIDSS